MLDLFNLLSSPDVNWWTGVLWCFYQTLILTAPIHCRASIDSHSDGTHSLQSIHWLSFWRHPFTAEHPLTLILTAPIHCRASIDSHSDGTHSLQSIHWLSFWRHPFTTEHPLLRHISPNLMKKQTHPNLRMTTFPYFNNSYSRFRGDLFLYLNICQCKCVWFDIKWCGAPVWTWCRLAKMTKKWYLLNIHQCLRCSDCLLWYFIRW